MRTRAAALVPIDIAIAAALALLTWGLYARSATFAFIAFDDNDFIVNNARVTSGLSLANVRWAITVPYLGNWNPATWITYQAVYSVFAANPGAYHVLNFLLHGMSAALLFLFLVKATGARWPSAAAAALFAWHPLRVESVAWIAETKDCLCCFFWLATMLAYQRYASRPGTRRYLLVMLAAALALASKPTAVTLPCALLLLDYWPLQRAGNPRRWIALLVEKLPLAAMAVLPAAANFVSHQAMHGSTIDALVPPRARIENAIVSVMLYLRDTFCPTRLCLFYPHPSLVGLPIPTVEVIASATIIVVITCLCIWLARRCPALIVGWLWFLGTLVPAIGLVQVGAQARADRYTYVPAIGLSIGLVWGAVALLRAAEARGWSMNRAAAGASIVIAAALIVLTEMQLATWRDTTTVFARANAVTARNYLARSELSEQLLASGNVPAAVDLAQQAVEIAPMLPGPHRALAAALERAGADPAALSQWEAAIGNGGDESTSRDRAGAVLARLDRSAQAAQQFRIALRYDPHDVIAMNDLGILAAHQGHLDAAGVYWRRAIATAPGFGPPHGWLGALLQQRGDRGGAIEQFRAAVRAGEKRRDWLTALAWLEATTPATASTSIPPQQAIDDARAACEASATPDPLALDALAAALARAGQFDEAAANAANAAALAQAAGQPVLAKEIETRMMDYRAGRPYIAPAAIISRSAQGGR